MNIVSVNWIRNSFFEKNIFLSILMRSKSTLIYKNRNPRNLELLGLAQKTQGWELQSPRKDFWHKVILVKSAYHTKGLIFHHSSKIVLSASTEEPNIQKHLYSCVDVPAATNIGRILALRCQRSGLLELFFDTDENSLNNESIKAFYDSLLEGGISLQEPSGFIRSEPIGIDYDNMSESEKRALYPSLIETLRTTPDWDSIAYPYSLRPRAGKRKLKNSYNILSKVRQGMVWDSFYCRMVHPKNKAHWQHEFESWQIKKLESGDQDDTKKEPLEQIIPTKWQLT